MTLDVAFVQPEGELVDVPVQVLRADVVVDAVAAALQDRPDAFNAVRVGSATRVLASRMIDGIVTEEQPVKVT